MKTNTRRLSDLALTAIMLLCLLGGGWLATGAIGWLAPKPATAAVTASPAVPQYATKAIQDIHEGDEVLARDEHGREIGYRRVEEVYRRTSHHLRHLTFRTDYGSEQTFDTTDEHPFWSATAGAFVNAGDLAVGDEVTGPNGQAAFLAQTHRTEHPEGVAVFNFRVEGWHTYFVQSPEARGPPVLVHNADYGHVDGGVATPDQALDGATAYLGANYRDMGKGRYLSADGLRQVRLGNHEVKDPKNLHIHFEHYDVPARQGGSVVESNFTVIK